MASFIPAPCAKGFSTAQLQTVLTPEVGDGQPWMRDGGVRLYEMAMIQAGVVLKCWGAGPRQALLFAGAAALAQGSARCPARVCGQQQQHGCRFNGGTGVVLCCCGCSCS